jgi:hypothetical protein
MFFDINAKTAVRETKAPTNIQKALRPGLPFRNPKLRLAANKLRKALKEPQKRDTRQSSPAFFAPHGGAGKKTDIERFNAP